MDVLQQTAAIIDKIRLVEAKIAAVEAENARLRQANQELQNRLRASYQATKPENLAIIQDAPSGTSQSLPPVTPTEKEPVVQKQIQLAFENEAENAHSQSHTK
ncbi:MAG: hypothetical protein R2795_02105 [Saprospiraceae bacterium]